MWYGTNPPDPEQYERQTIRFPLPTGPVWATWVLLVINISVFALTYIVSVLISSGVLPTNDPACLQYAFQCALSFGWKWNAGIAQGEYWRLLTATFLHSDLMHIAFNGFALYLFGPALERIFGTPRFLTIYFLSGLAGSIASYTFSPSPAVGASGAIFGIIGALAVFYYLGRDILGDAGQQQLRSMLVIIGLNIFLGLTPGSSIDNFGHLGGLIGGALTGWLLAPRYSIDNTRYPPTLVRRYSALDWAGATGVLVILILLMFTVPPAQ